MLVALDYVAQETQRGMPTPEEPRPTPLLEGEGTGLMAFDRESDLGWH